MNRVISWLPKLQLRQILTAFFVGLIFFATALGQFSYARAQAAPLTPEAKDYQVNNTEQSPKNAKKAGEGLKGTAETIKEKLNLDEPLPESTKDFFKQIRGEEVTIEEPRPFGKGQEPQNE
ncbi:hypothetical protein IQ238_17450 [Pleurocapsales cyanobacterium LEGE 06147]|nr:hypothetical protein [Pleurocapsales cyanobacterium LEGE 06147]